jgi:hypothetical protein
MTNCGECNGETKNAYKILARNPGWKRPIGRPSHALENNIKIEPK